jgi:hypothetical protein
MVLIIGAAVVVTALLTAALLAILGRRFLRTRLDAAGDQLAAKVRMAVTEAVEEALPRVREAVAEGMGEAGEEILPRLRAEVEGGVRDAAEDALPQFREQVRDGFSEALASAVTGGVLGKAGEELVRKGGGVLDMILGTRRDDED